MVTIQTNMDWEAVALSKYNKMLNLIPIFHRRLTQEVVNKKAEQVARERGSAQVQEIDIVQAFLIFFNIKIPSLCHLYQPFL